MVDLGGPTAPGIKEVYGLLRKGPEALNGQEATVEDPRKASRWNRIKCIYHCNGRSNIAFLRIQRGFSGCKRLCHGSRHLKAQPEGS